MPIEEDDPLKGASDGKIDGVPFMSQSQADVVLFMPFNIVENYQVSWSGANLGIIGGGVDQLEEFARNSEDLDWSRGSFINMGKGASAKIQELWNSSDLQSGAKTAGAIAAGHVVGKTDVAKKVMQNFGLSINPNFELFFEGVQPRTFTFDFKMSPRNQAESDAIQAIVRTFKTYAAPEETQDSKGFFWDYPCYFQIEYWNAEKLHRLKPAALQSIQINYTGTGTNHTFYDGSPVQVDLTLTFTEASLVTRKDVVAGC